MLTDDVRSKLEEAMATAAYPHVAHKYCGDGWDRRMYRDMAVEVMKVVEGVLVNKRRMKRKLTLEEGETMKFAKRVGGRGK